MQEIIFLRGLPASGKSSYAIEMIRQDSKLIRLNKDSIRIELNIKAERDIDFWSSSFEKDVLSYQKSKGMKYLNDGYSLIIDDTNISKKHYDFWKDVANKRGIKFTLKEFNVDVEECIRRDAARENPVGEKVIRTMDKQMKQSLFKIDVRKITQQDRSLPKRIIVDIDGTVALMDGRSPYQPDMTDKPNRPLIDLLQLRYTPKEIIIFTGRQEKDRKVTEEWLLKNGVYYSKLVMRKTNDYRSDQVAKKEMYEEHVKDKYYVEAVFDDRNQVVDMWRELGLLCLQVYYGDF